MWQKAQPTKRPHLQPHDPSEGIAKVTEAPTATLWCASESSNLCSIEGEAL